MKKYLIGFVAGILITSSSLTLAFTYSGMFSDVKATEWYTEAVESLAKNGIVSGYKDGTYRPGNTVNRAEVAAMLNRTLEFMEYNYDQFPIAEDGEPFEQNYRICTSPETHSRIYESYFCGDDSCWSTFYNFKGDKIEASKEYGPGTGNNRYEPTTQTQNCRHTTEQYFKSKVHIE